MIFNPMELRNCDLVIVRQIRDWCEAEIRRQISESKPERSAVDFDSREAVAVAKQEMN